jgi:Tfp pilus assembly protein PilF
MTEYRRGVLFSKSGNPAEAARILGPVAAAEPGNTGVRLPLALAYFGSAQLARAEAELRVLVEHNPSDHYATTCSGVPWSG